ncbi:MAG TPA: ATP-binding cassette domain-containing protein [Vicinamibacteria bacterium]|nr:ATP-binding cassette domain-containing protein [Vicinamibacteria bacterium]
MIQLEDVTKTFGDVVAIDHVSARLESGLTHVLLGSSGCGKSTILRLILGLITPDSGAIRVDGRGAGGPSPSERGRIGYVVQQGGLYPHLTSRRNVSLPAEARRWDEGRIRARVGELAELVGLDDTILQLYPTELSGGQRQRVSLMRALVLDPPILLLDEPLGSLDALVRAELQEQLKAIFSPMGKTVVLVTHDIREASFFGHTITLMTEGRIVQSGSFADLAKRPASEFVTAFLNAQRPTPEMRDLLW